MTPVNEVRVPVRIMRFSPLEYARRVWEFTSGAMGAGFVTRLCSALQDPDPKERLGINAMTFAPLGPRTTGAAFIFDPEGLRLEGSREVAFAILWSEVSRVALHRQRSHMLGLTTLRLVLWPAHPQAFVDKHPGVEAAWDAELGAFGVGVSTAPRVDPEPALLGLRFAGDRFRGQVEDLPDLE